MSDSGGEILKTLVSGSVMGNFDKLFDRVNTVNQKAGPFDVLLCVGDFFGDRNPAGKCSELSARTAVPDVPVYVLSPMHPISRHQHGDNYDQGFELTNGVTFLGRAGVLTTSHGLRIAYLNGRYKPTANLDQDYQLQYYTDKEFDSLLMQCETSSDVVDILLTIEWPEDLLNHTTIVDGPIKRAVESMRKFGSWKISQLCNAIRPRYHFVDGRGFEFERAPYRNHNVLNETSRNVTRFISLAEVGNPKMKWLYAFHMKCGRHMSAKELNFQPAGVTENPYKDCLRIKLQQNDAEQSQSNQFRYDLTGNTTEESDSGRRPPNDSKRKSDHQSDRPPRREMKVDLANCWFCLASPNVDKSLIVSIGNHAYLALAKGGLTPDHMLILPIEHIRSTVEIENDELRGEIEKFKNALTGFYKQRGMVPVFFERNFRCPHFQIHVVGLPEDKVECLKQAVQEVFAKFECNEMNTKDELEDVLAPGVPYFHLDCYNHYKFFVRINTKQEFFPIQIGRELMAHKLLLNCPEKIDWKQCANDHDQNEQSESAQNIRKSFQPFDFTIG